MRRPYIRWPLNRSTTRAVSDRFSNSGTSMTCPAQPNRIAWKRRGRRLISEGLDWVLDGEVLESDFQRLWTLAVVDFGLGVAQPALYVVFFLRHSLHRTSELYVWHIVLAMQTSSLDLSPLLGLYHPNFSASTLSQVVQCLSRLSGRLTPLAIKVTVFLLLYNLLLESSYWRCRVHVSIATLILIHIDGRKRDESAETGDSAEMGHAAEKQAQADKPFVGTDPKVLLEQKLKFLTVSSHTIRFCYPVFL
ncbi:hypothetical protein NMY22_g7463 [Coprinellus aureogranulatus]|nr:hypothetical protein NMY22_g7463 [Coprinellus aureogranulatus]